MFTDFLVHYQPTFTLPVNNLILEYLLVAYIDIVPIDNTSEVWIEPEM